MNRSRPCCSGDTAKSSTKEKDDEALKARAIASTQAQAGPKPRKQSTKARKQSGVEATATTADQKQTAADDKEAKGELFASTMLQTDS